MILYMWTRFKENRRTCYHPRISIFPWRWKIGMWKIGKMGERKRRSFGSAWEMKNAVSVIAIRTLAF